MLPTEGFCSKEEVRKGISKGANGTGIGPDEVANEALKSFLKILAHVWKALLNLMLWTGVWPSLFDTAVVAPLEKSGKDVRDASGYRCIHLWSRVAKLAQRLVDRRIRQPVLLSPYHRGFVDGGTCLGPIFILYVAIHCALRGPGHQLLVLLDLQTAFPRVPRILIYIKARMLGVHWMFLRLVVVMCRNTCAAVVLCLWWRTAKVLMAASGEAQERNTKRGLLVYSAWRVGSQLPRGT